VHVFRMRWCVPLRGCLNPRPSWISASDEMTRVVICIFLQDLLAPGFQRGDGRGSLALGLSEPPENASGVIQPWLVDVPLAGERI
jgi:hypothetical protein